MFIAICYQAYSEAVNRDGFFGLKPRQDYIDYFWNRELAPRITDKYKQAISRLEEQAKADKKKVKNNEKPETKKATKKK